MFLKSLHKIFTNFSLLLFALLTITITNLAYSQTYSKSPQKIEQKNTDEVVSKPSTTKILYKTIDTAEIADFLPEKGYFFIKYDNGVTKLLTAEFYSLDTISKSGSAARYVFGAVVNNTNIEPKARFSLVAFSSTGKIITTEDEPLLENIQENDQGDSLRIQTKDLNIEIKSLEEKKKKLDDELRRIRADIDVLSGSGKLKDIDKEITQTTDELEALKRNSEFLKQLLTSVKTVKEPRSFQQREASLIQKISTLNYEVSKIVESEPAEATSRLSNDRKKMLADIGRAANIGALTKELEELRSRRIELEQE